MLCGGEMCLKEGEGERGEEKKEKVDMAGVS